MFRTKIVFLTLIILGFYYGYSQEEGCSKSKVGVVEWDYSVEDDSAFFNYMSQQYGFKTEQNWIKEIEERVFAELKANSPETEFVKVSDDIPEECSYYFRYAIDLIGAGRDIPVPWAEGVVKSEYTAYYMSSKFASKPACGFPGYVLGIEITDDDREIHSTIHTNIAAFGNIEDKIEKWEESHLTPARGPKIIITNSRDYVSPLKEKRSLDIKIDVTNCKNQTVYDEDDGQPVFVPRKTDRGINEPTHLFPQYQVVTDNIITLFIVRPVGGSATYTLNKGLDAEIERMNLVACGLDKKVVKEAEIPIYGLEIEVNPNRRQISCDEKTDIKIMFNEIDPDGNAYPVVGKELEVEISGLENGTITPLNSYTTDQKGEIILKYKAGDKDKMIAITGSYQPHEYPEKVIGEASIDIRCDYEWSGTMTVEKLERFDCQLDKSTDDSWGRTKLHELSTTRATINILAENIDDSPPGFNINMGENLIVSGFMKCEYNNTEIKNGRKSGVNPSSFYHKETLVGDDLFNLSHKNLNLMFTGNMGDLQQDGSLEELTRMLESGEMDQAKLEAFGKKFEESMGTGESGQSKITVFLTIFGDCECKAILNQNGWVEKNGERTTTDESVNMDLAIGGGVAIDFTADYIRKKDGSASITGNYSKTTPISGGHSAGCPPKEETITCTLDLSKRPKQ